MNNVRYNVNKYFAINNVIGVVDEDNNLYMSVVNDDNQKIWINARDKHFYKLVTYLEQKKLFEK